MSATVLSPKCSRFLSICRSIGLRSPTAGASPSWLLDRFLDLVAKRRLAFVAEQEGPQPAPEGSPIRWALLLESSGMGLGLHLCNRIGVGDADRGQRLALDLFHRLGILVGCFVVIA